MKISVLINCVAVAVNIVIGIVLIDSIRINNVLMTEHKKEIVESNYQLAQQLTTFVEQKETQIYAKVQGDGTQILSILNQVFDELMLNRQVISDMKTVLHINDVHNVEVTAYTAAFNETDADPQITASMTKPIPGKTIAVSRDLFYSGWTFGKSVYIEGQGLFVIQDLMAKKWTMKIDICTGTKVEARQFGKKRLTAVLLTI